MDFRKTFEKLINITNIPFYWCLFCLWYILPKKYETIKSVVIPYVKIPVWVIWPLMRCDPEGFVVHVELFNKAVIFITTNRFLRCIVYHEYWENKILTSRKNVDQLLDLITPRFQLLLEVYGIENKQPVTPVLSESLRSWAENNGPHAVAILKEIELAKEELSPNELTSLYRIIREKRRFALRI